MDEAEDEIGRRGEEAAPQVSGAAWSLLGAASREKADTFLDEQIAIARLQKEHLHEQRDLLIAQLTGEVGLLNLKRFDEKLGIGLKLLTIGVGTAFAAALCWMVWNAANDHALVVEPFAAPPESVLHGDSGEAMAARVLDEIRNMDARTESASETNTYANGWEGDTKLEIPETGISISELDRWLKKTLGHETRITGALRETRQGYDLTVRAGERVVGRFSGAPSDLDGMLQRAAEALYGETQPYRYSKYLEGLGRAKESMAVAQKLTRGAPEWRAWAWGQVANLDLIAGHFRAGVDAGTRAVALDPSFAIGYLNRAGGEEPLGLGEAALQDTRRAVVETSRHPERMSAQDIDAWGPVEHALIADYEGDRTAAAAHFAALATKEDFQHVSDTAPAFRDYERALNHEIPDAAARTATPRLSRISFYMGQIAFFPDVIWAAAAARGDWHSALAELDAEESAARGQGEGGATHIARWVIPLRAEGLAKLGRGEEAVREASRAPLDCDLCLRMRGVARAATGNMPAAAYWFVRAENFGPSLPFAYAAWGGALLHHGDFDAAIVKFREANEKGPHFADPLEMWGEALMQKNRSDLALAKFEEANKYAPNWGHLHLEWGEALTYAGKPDAAKKQFATAAGLELSQSDKAALAKWTGTHG